MKKNSYRGMTLAELLIALVLFGLVVTGISAFDIFGNFHAITFDRRAVIQNELSLALEHMNKTIIGGSLTPGTNAKRGGAIGDTASSSNYPFVVDSDKAGVRIKIDSNNNGILDSNDVWTGYKQDGTNLYYYAVDNSPTNPNHGTVTDTIASHLLPTNSTTIAAGTQGFSFTTPVTIATSSLPAYNACRITLRSRWQPASAASLDNPQLELTATMIAPSVSTG